MRVVGPTTTRVLAALDGQGLIRRSRDPQDGRQLSIEITQDGAALLLQRVAEGDRWLSDELARAFTPVERRVLALAADILNDYLGDSPRP